MRRVSASRWKRSPAPLNISSKTLILTATDRATIRATQLTANRNSRDKFQRQAYWSDTPDEQFTYKATLRCDLVTTVTVEKQYVLHILSVCL